MAQREPIRTKVSHMTLQEIIEAYTPESMKLILADYETKGKA